MGTSNLTPVMLKEKALHVKAVVLLIMTAVLWSFGGVLIKSIQWNPMAIAGMRSAIAILVLLLVVRKNHLRLSVYRIAGAVFYAATVILYVCANKLTTAANVILLQYTAPIYVAIFSVWFLKEHINKWDWIVIVTALLGMCLFFFGDLSPGTVWGNILSLICGMTFALMIVFMRKQKDGSPVSSVFIGNILTLICMLPFMFHDVPGDRTSWLALFFLGTFQLGLSYVLYSIAIKYVTALEAVMITLIEPLINPVWAFMILGERPSDWAVIGGIVVIGSLILHSKIRLK